MRRTTGLFLLATGGLFLLLTVVGVMILFEQGQAGGFFLLWVVLGLVGALLVYAGIRVMRGTRPLGAEPERIKGRVQGYLADETESHEHAGKPYDVLYTPPIRGKHARPSSLVVSVPACTPTTLQFNEENWFDRLCKRLGIAREHQTGDEIFDRSVYVRGPSDGYAEAYLQDEAKRVAILSLRKLGFPVVQLTGEKIEAVWKHFDPAIHDQEKLTEQAGGNLHALAKDRPQANADIVGAKPFPSLLPLASFWSFSVFYSFFVIGVFIYPPVRDSALILPSLGLFVLVFFALGWISAYFLRGGSTSHDHWARLMSLGVLLIGMGSVGMVAFVNSVGDEGVTNERSIIISSKRIVSGKRGSKSHRVTIPAWDRPGDTFEFRISSNDYLNAVPGSSRMVVITGNGLLGIEWIQSKRVQR